MKPQWGANRHAATCEAIAGELAMAYAEAWYSADADARRAWTLIQKMRTEEGVQRAEELMRSRPHPGFRGQPKLDELARRLGRSPILRALQKKDAHESRTGHKVQWGSE